MTAAEAPIVTDSPTAPAALPLSIGDTALLRLLQLCSPALPIGAFAYSQGLEPAVAAGWVRDEETTATWIGGLLRGSLATLDLPALVRLHAAWRQRGDDDGNGGNDDDASTGTADDWTAFLSACRPSAELQAEDRQLGGNLARVLAGLGLTEAAPWMVRADVTYAAMFALAAARWDVPLGAALSGYAFVWCETQVSAAVRLVPLGQSAGQRVVSSLSAAIPAVVARALTVTDDDMGAAAPSLAIASAIHETQYSRLFRS
ncbi:MAG: urease accessory protein [Myxococcales bacterium]|jgi:urease accessory protein|nr:urease accessory protein [Myxococcales bacterium]